MHLHNDIPVVKVVGEWDEPTRQHICDLVIRLASAGHLEMILDLSGMSVATNDGCSWLRAVEEIAAQVLKQRGRLDIVGTLEQIQQNMLKRTHSRLFWAVSEDVAVGHLKGLPNYRGGSILAMRFAR